MRRLQEVLENVILQGRAPAECYGRIFVVSAFAGVTNALFSDKKTGQSGVFELFATGDSSWETALEQAGELMKEIHSGFVDLGLDVAKADAFVEERISGIQACLKDMIRVSVQFVVERGESRRAQEALHRALVEP